MESKMKENATYTLGIDLGTSSCKIAVINPSGKIIDSDTERYPLYLTSNGGAEQEPKEWWDSIVKATRRIMERGSVSKENIVGVGVTGQFSGTVPVGSDSVPLRKAIIWMDTRGERYIRKLTGGLLNVSGYRADKLRVWINKTGGAPAHSGKDSVSHILFLKSEEPEIYNETFKFLEPKDYINLKLSGRFFSSYDSIVLYWVTDNRDLNRIRYDDKLLKLSQLDSDKLPELRASTDIIGELCPEVADELMLKAGTKIVAGAGDMQSSLIGSGATLDFQSHIYLGTSSWFTAHVPFKKTDIFHNIASLPSSIPNRYFIAAEQESAGICLQHVREILYCTNGQDCDSQVPPFPALDALAEQSPAGSDGLIFLPWLYGERAPIEDKYIRGAFYNLSLQTNRPSMLRSVLEGVAYNTRWLLDPIEKFSGHRAEPIRIAGGGASSHLWCEILSNVLNRTIHVVDSPFYANARGSALLAAVSLGLTDFERISESISIIRECRPTTDKAKVYQGIFKHFIEFYHNNRRSYRKLNDQNLNH